MAIPDRGTSAPMKYQWLLIGSLALNLLVVGAVAGMFFRHRGGGGPNGPPELNIGRLVNSDQGLRGFVRTLPQERRQALRAVVEDARQTLKPLRQTVRAARADASATLKAEPFDPAKFQTSMEAVIIDEGAARRASVAIMVDAVKQMTPQERVSFQAWRKKFERMGPNRQGEPPEGVPEPPQKS